ncbi:alpha/beta fold hydrolase [Paenibacillus sp. BR2-3]|uniref:alpha/beta fold hydrolase n=1 Tax=Paenibacillus sp. BR2-3 TaxID=3048494 RepID=UPI0039777C02
MRPEQSGTILWLTGWSMSDRVFDRLRDLLPDFNHVSLDYSSAVSSEEILHLTETAAKNILSSHSGPLLIGGWSLGGLLALRLAAQELADGLVLLSATARFTRPKEQTDRGWADAYVRQMITGIRKDRQAIVNKFSQTVFMESKSEMDHREILPLIGHWTTSALIAGLEILRGVECLSRLPEITCPVLLVHGAEDKICPYAAAEELLSQLPRAKLLTIPGSGHAPFLGRETHLAESLRSWWHDQ